MRSTMPAIPQTSDTELAQRIRHGDHDALGTLYDRHASVAVAVAYRVLGNRDQAEDVVHDAFVIVWQRIPRFDPNRGSLKAWLMTIVRNRAIDCVRATRSSVDTDTADEQNLLRTSLNPTWDEAVERLSTDQLRRAVAALPDDQRTAVELAYFGGHTYREIATLTGVPHGTASGRMRLALVKLRVALSGSEAAPLSTSVHVDR